VAPRLGEEEPGPDAGFVNLTISDSDFILATC
jgi:hypothetical protein